MWGSILFTIVIFFYFFDKITNKKIKVQYKELINFLMNFEDGVSLISESKKSVLLRRQVPQGWTRFFIERQKDRLVIEWENKDIFLGRLCSKWQFKFTTSNREIINVISADILKMNEQLKNQNSSN